MRGTALIVALGLTMLCSAAALAMASRLSHEIRLSAYQQANAQALVLARDGVYLALDALSRDAEAGRVDWRGEPWALPQELAVPSGGFVRVSVTDEDRKLDLNLCDGVLLAAVLSDHALAEAILSYRALRDGQIMAPEELSHLPGMDHERYSKLEAQTSPYRAGGTKLNLNTATPEVLSAMGLRPTTVEAITRFREGPDGTERHGQDGVFQDPATLLQTLVDLGVVLEPAERTVVMSQFGVASETFIVLSEGISERPSVHVRIRAVVRRSSDHAKPPRILAWREGT